MEIKEFKPEEIIKDLGLAPPDSTSTKPGIVDINRSMFNGFYNYRTGIQTMSVKILEVHDKSLTVGGIPNDFDEYLKTNRAWIAETYYNIVGFVGTYACGVLYLDNEESLKDGLVGKYINIRLTKKCIT